MRKPIQRELPQPVELPGMMPPTINREWRGVNTFDPLSIGDDFFTDMRNFCTDDYPAVSVRPGYTSTGQFGSKVLGMGVWQGREMHVVFNDGTWRRWDGAAWATLKSGLDNTAKWSFTSFEGDEWADVNLVGANGVNGLHRYDGTTVQTFGDAPASLNFVTTFQNRLWGANGKDLHACALDRPSEWNDFDPQTIDENSYIKTIESIHGESISALSGGLTKLTIAMPNSLHELYGTMPQEFTVNLITENYGMSNNESVSTLGGSMRFIHPTGLYEWQGGTIPSSTYADIASGYTHNIPAGTSSGADRSKQYFALGDKVLVYDTRMGVQAWSVWSDVAPTCFVMFKNELYIGDSSGRVLKLGGKTNAGTPINAYLITKPFTNQSVAQRQRWLKMHTVWELDAGSTLRVSLSRTVDGNDWEQVHSVTGSGLRPERIIIPVQSFVLENTVRVRFDITGWGRLHELTRQVRALPLR